MEGIPSRGERCVLCCVLGPWQEACVDGWHGLSERNDSICALVAVTQSRTLTSVRARVDLEVFRACEHLAAIGKCAWKRLLPGVHANVINEFVFGFERLPAAHTLVPHTDVTEAFQPRSYMLGGDVVHELVHGAESLIADGCRRPPKPLSWRSSVNPFAH